MDPQNGLFLLKCIWKLISCINYMSTFLEFQYISGKLGNGIFYEPEQWDNCLRSSLRRKPWMTLFLTARNTFTLFQLCAVFHAEVHAPTNGYSLRFVSSDHVCCLSRVGLWVELDDCLQKGCQQYVEYHTKRNMDLFLFVAIIPCLKT